MVIFSLAYPWSRGKEELWDLQQWDVADVFVTTRRAWAGLNLETPSSVLRVCAAIAVLCNEVFPYCSSGSSQSRERAGTVCLWGKKELTFLYLAFLSLNLLHSLFLREQLAVSFSTAGKHPAGLYLQPCREGGHRPLPGRGQCPQSWLRGQKWWKRPVCLSWEMWFTAWLGSSPPDWKFVFTLAQQGAKGVL